MADQTYGVYVIELDGNPPKRLYVGYSAHSPGHRLSQHLVRGYLAAKVFKQGATGKLCPDLCEHLPRHASRQAAEKAERELASRLREDGYSVSEGLHGISTT
jgi:hypothetical protein